MRLLFVRGGALGDFVVTLGVLERMLATGAVVDVACDPRRRTLLERVPGAERLGELLPLDSPAQAWTVGAGRAPRAWDAALAWTPRAADGLLRAGVPVVGAAASVPPSGRSAYEHVHDALLPLVSAGLVPAGPARPPRLRGGPRAAGAPGRDGVAWLAPGAGGPAKRPPLPWWEAVARALEAAGVPVGWLAGPVEAEEAWVSTPGRRVETPELPGLVERLAGAGVLLCPDSGPGHLAAALRRGDPGAREGAALPVGVVFRATEPACWAPPGARVFGAEGPGAGGQRPGPEPSVVAAWAADVLRG